MDFPLQDLVRRFVMQTLDRSTFVSVVFVLFAGCGKAVAPPASTPATDPVASASVAPPTETAPPAETAAPPKAPDPPLSQPESPARVLAESLNQPFQLVADGEALYWTEMAGGRVMKLPKTGGTPFGLVEGFTNPTGLALDGSNVYYTLQTKEGLVKSVAKAGPKVGFAFIARDQPSPTGIFADESSVIWAVGDAGAKNGGVVLYTKADKKARPLVRNRSRPFEIVADSKNVYWWEQPTKELWKVSRKGTDARLLAKLDCLTVTLAQDDDSVYYTCEREVRAVPKAGGAPRTIAAVTDLFTRGLARDGDSLYFGAMVRLTVSFTTKNPDKAVIMKVAKTGGTPSTVVERDGANVVSLVVDEGAVYWISDVAGAVMTAKR